MAAFDPLRTLDRTPYQACLQTEVPMESSTKLALFIPVFAVLAFIFGRNGHRGVRTGAVYAKSTRYLREEEPILFWLAVAFSFALAAVCVAAVAIAIWALATLT